MPKKTKNRTRANNGMGSIRLRSDGRWEARYTTPFGIRSVYGKSEKEVGKKLREQLHAIDIGSWQEPSKMLLSTWLDIWLSDYQSHVTERTIAKHRCIINKYFKPVLGHIRLTNLVPLHVRRLVTVLQADGKADTTINNYIAILRSSLVCAIEAGIIKSNPVDPIKLPHGTPKTFCIIDRGDIPAFIAAAQDTACTNELLMMLYTGMRVGEVRGLEWDDCDIETATIHIQRQLHPNRANMKRVSTPKYNETRLLHVPPEVVALLKDQRRLQAQYRLAAGDRWTDDDISSGLVFRQKNGKPHSEKSIYRAVKSAGVAIGKPDLHPHDLRHSYAIAALRSGVDVKTVQHNLGHRTSSMTLDVYAAYTEDAGKQGAIKLSEYLKNTEK